jgi:hypothetical protein
MTTPTLSLPSAEELRAIAQRAAKLRSEAVHDLLGRGFRAVAGGLVRRVSAALATQRLYDELGAMSDRELLDIGLTRTDLSPDRLAVIAADETLLRNRKPAPSRPAPANENLRSAA